jgi:hypothetical protein
MTVDRFYHSRRELTQSHYPIHGRMIYNKRKDPNNVLTVVRWPRSEMKAGTDQDKRQLRNNIGTEKTARGVVISPAQ